MQQKRRARLEAHPPSDDGPGPAASLSNSSPMLPWVSSSKVMLPRVLRPSSRASGASDWTYSMTDARSPSANETLKRKPLPCLFLRCSGDPGKGVSGGGGPRRRARGRCKKGKRDAHRRLPWKRPKPWLTDPRCAMQMCNADPHHKGTKAAELQTRNKRLFSDIATGAFREEKQTLGKKKRTYGPGGGSFGGPSQPPPDPLPTPTSEKMRFTIH